MSMQVPVIRKFTGNDYPVVKKIWELTGVDRPERGDDLAKIEYSIMLGGELLLLVLDKFGVIGTSWMTFDGRRIHLHHFAIHPDHQGKGYSKMFLKESLNIGKKRNIQMKLEVHRNNSKAINLYRKFGFEYLGDYEIFIIRDYSEIEKNTGING